MKKMSALFVLILAFCVVGFAQSAPKTAKKAILLPNNTQIKDGKTGQVIRVTKGTVPTPTPNAIMTITRSGVNTPGNSNKSSGNAPVKQLPKRSNKQ